MELCEKCGAELNENGVCPKCSEEATISAKETETAIEEKPEAAPEAPASKPSTSDTGVIKRVIAALAALALIVCCFLLTGRSAKSTAKQYVKAALNGNAKKIVKLLPKDEIKFMLDVNFDGDKGKMYDEIEKSTGFLKKALEAQNIKPSDVKIKVKDVEDMNNDELKAAKIKLHNIKIKKGKKVKLELTIPGEDDKQELTIDTVKLGRKWYVSESGF